MEVGSFNSSSFSNIDSDDDFSDFDDGDQESEITFKGAADDFGFLRLSGSCMTNPFSLFREASKDNLDNGSANLFSDKDPSSAVKVFS